jgi:subtilase family serine protease
LSGGLKFVWLTPAQFAARFGPSAADMAGAAAALEAAGLQVTEVHSRSLHVTASAGQTARTFRTTLRSVKEAGGSGHIVAATKLTLPDALAAYGAVIPAFAPVPNHHVDSRLMAASSANVGDKGGAISRNRLSNVGAYYYDDLKQAYDYPSYQSVLPNGKQLNGAGVNVAVMMDSDSLNSDITLMFDNENYTATTGKPVPTVAHVYVDGGGAVGGGDTAEASLDTQQAQGGAPGASVTIVSLPSLADQYILDGYVSIVDGNKFDIVSSSFGACELNYTAAYNGGVDYTGVFRVYDEIFQQGNAQGITFVASSGDSGGLGCPQAAYFFGAQSTHFIPGVENPASSPNVTAVGGGNLLTTIPPMPQTTPPTLTSKYVHENAKGDKEVPYDAYGQGSDISGGYWGAGGGQSVVFAAPAYQAGAYTGSPARTVPDVGMEVGGCPSGLALRPCHPDDSSAITYIEGGVYAYIGTSIASPEFAGALALYVEAQGARVGNVNPYLYQQSVIQNQFGGAAANPAVQFFHKNIDGYDGHWTQRKPSGLGYTYLVGNGTPDVRKLFGLTQYAPAGTPQSPSNP